MKRAATLVLVMLAMSASAAVDAREGQKTQWAPTRNFSSLNARTVFAGESRRATSPYAGEESETAAAAKEAGFTGHRTESALELIYAEQRWLDPLTGTWMSRDPVGASSYLARPNELYAFGYAAGNPARHVDADGRQVVMPNPFTALKSWVQNWYTKTEQSGPVQATAGVGDAVVEGVQGFKAAEHAYRMAQMGMRPDGSAMSKEEHWRFLMADAQSPGSPAEKLARGLSPVALMDPRVQQDLIRGLPEMVQGTGEGLGEGASLAVDGKPREAAKRLAPALLKTVMLVEGGRGLGAQAAEMGLLRGSMFEDFALPATRQTLNPRNWTVELYENALGSGPPVKKLTYRGPQIRDGVPTPFGFKTRESFEKFVDKAYAEFATSGFYDVEFIFQGSSVTGRSARTGAPFGAASDFDIALTGGDILEAAAALGIRPAGGPLTSTQLGALGLLADVQKALSASAGRRVEFLLVESRARALKKGPSIPVPYSPVP